MFSEFLRKEGKDTKTISRKKQKKQEKQRSALKNELKRLKKAGVTLSLNGAVCTPKEIVEACCIQEECTYMRDYVADEKGEIHELRFDKVQK